MEIITRFSFNLEKDDRIKYGYGIHDNVSWKQIRSEIKEFPKSNIEPSFKCFVLDDRTERLDRASESYVTHIIDEKSNTSKKINGIDYFSDGTNIYTKFLIPSENNNIFRPLKKHEKIDLSLHINYLDYSFGNIMSHIHFRPLTMIPLAVSEFDDDNAISIESRKKIDFSKNKASSSLNRLVFFGDELYQAVSVPIIYLRSSEKLKGNELYEIIIPSSMIKKKKKIDLPYELDPIDYFSLTDKNKADDEARRRLNITSGWKIIKFVDCISNKLKIYNYNYSDYDFHSNIYSKYQSIIFENESLLLPLMTKSSAEIYLNMKNNNDFKKIGYIVDEINNIFHKFLLSGNNSKLNEKYFFDAVSLGSRITNFQASEDINSLSCF